DSLNYTDASGNASQMQLQDVLPDGNGGLLVFGNLEGDVGTVPIPAGWSITNYWYFYDANGNVSDIINSADGSLAAHYESTPYGGDLVATGPFAQTNPFRFSTKYIDVESGLYYYGYRYYSPRLSRWMSRDPAEEFDSANIYAFAGNGPTNGVDPLGL